MRQFNSYMDLTGQGREIDCRYHGNETYISLEARVFEEKGDNLMVGVSFHESDIPEHNYNLKTQSLDVLYRPYGGIRTMELAFTEFAVPKDIKAINVYDVDQGLPK